MYLKRARAVVATNKNKDNAYTVRSRGGSEFSMPNNDSFPELAPFQPLELIIFNETENDAAGANCLLGARLITNLDDQGDPLSGRAYYDASKQSPNSVKGVPESILKAAQVLLDYPVLLAYPK